MSKLAGNEAAGVPTSALPDNWPELVSQDLAALTWLHQQERSCAVLRACAAGGFPHLLTLPGRDSPAVQAMAQALEQLPAGAAAAGCGAGQPAAPDDRSPVTPLAEACDRDLAADYAAIYLTHHLRAAPQESVWLDEDHLILQGPTFEVRDFYRRHGVRVTQWRVMPDDHLCHELNFVAILMARSELQEAAEFMHLHLMRWLPLFCERVAQRSATRLYAALASLTLAYCQALQQALPKPQSPRTVAVTLQRQGKLAEGCTPG